MEMIAGICWVAAVVARAAVPAPVGIAVAVADAAVAGTIADAEVVVAVPAVVAPSEEPESEGRSIDWGSICC